MGRYLKVRQHHVPYRAFIYQLSHAQRFFPDAMTTLLVENGDSC